MARNSGVEELEAYLCEPSSLLNEIYAAARQAASAIITPQVQVVSTEKYGLFGNKTRAVSKGAGYWILKTVTEYGLQEPVASGRGNGTVTDLEHDWERSYCLNADGRLFSFTHETEGGVLDGRWVVFADRTGQREPIESNLDQYLADFDFSVHITRTTPFFRERLSGVAQAVRAAEGSESTGVERVIDVKGQGLLEHLKGMH